MAERLELSPAAAEATLEAMQENGLISMSTEPTPRMLPAPPQLAIEALILRQREQMERIRVYAAQLAEQYHRNPRTGNMSEYVELIYGEDTFIRRFEQLQRSAEREILVLSKAPYVAPIEEQEKTEREVLSAGVTVKGIYERESLEEFDGHDRVTRLLGEGEQARVLASLPLKMTIADRRLALLPLDTEQPQAGPAVLVYASALLDALSLLFDMLWDRAAPIGLRSDASRSFDKNEGDHLSDRDLAVLQLLQAGLTDAAIARQLNVTERTANRRVRDLMMRTETQTRFQLGWRVSQLGWLGDQSLLR